ncbi:hypothetical protein ACHAXR_011026 [Thalassiosira sp. AJA248-18]
MKNKSRRKKSSAHMGRKNGHLDKHHHVNPVKQDEVHDGDLKGMKQWIETLTYESLLSALEFTFRRDGGEHRQQNCNGGLCGNSGSHEFDLLMEMTSLQCPNDNGQLFDELENSHGWRRYMKSRLESPCLFRWDDSEADSNANEPQKLRSQDETKAGPSRDDPLASLAMGTSGMPSELLDVLAKAGVTRSTSALLETFYEDDEIDNTFEALEDCQDNTTKPLPTTFNVKADQGIADDGTSLGMGTTIDQQNADKSMLLWTAFIWDRALSTSEEKSPDKSKSSLPRCTLNITSEATTNKQQFKKLVLGTLHVASRGRFLSEAMKHEHFYLAPWFEPTQQWFSLSLYLASRFEASLWDAYLRRSGQGQLSDDSKKNSLVQSVKNLDRDAIDRVLSYAIGVGMRDDIDQSKNIVKRQSSADTVRDTLLWKLLLWIENGSMLLRQHPRSDGFAVISLLELDTPLGKLKSLVMDHLQEGLAHEAEQSLMQSIPAEGTQKSKTNKKKKKRAKKKGRHANQIKTNKLEDAQWEDNQNSDEDEEPHVERILPNTPSGTLSGFCEAAALDRSPQSEGNSTKMAVLKVLDDILAIVFTRLGVQDEEGFNDFTDAVTVKSRGETLQREAKSQSEETQSVGGIEVATTALVSNKAGTIVDATMSFLQRRGHGRNRSQSSIQSQHLWASRSRRQTLEGSQQNYVSHLKRSKSSGDGVMAEEKSPKSASKIQPPPPRSSSHSDSPRWPSSDSPLFPAASQNETSIFDGAPLCLSGALDGWNSVACQKQNETSIFTDLLKHSVYDHHNSNLASSTAASIASSRGDVEDAGLDIDDDCVDSPLVEECGAIFEASRAESFSDANKAVHFKDIKVQNVKSAPVESSEQPPCQSTLADVADEDISLKERVESPLPAIISDSPPSIESPTPSAPPTPPPQLSPILVSLADLGKLREEAASIEFKGGTDGLPPTPTPFSTIPKLPTIAATVSRTLTPSLSRDDLRSIDECWKPPRRDRDDHHAMGHRQVDALLSYRNVVAQSVPRKPPSLRSYDGKQKLRDDAHPIIARSTRSSKTTRSGTWRPGPEFPRLSSSVTSVSSYKEPILNKVLHLDVECARSEGGLEGVDDVSHCNVIPRVQTDDTMTKDGATTISSVRSPPEAEQLSTLKEERNSYRDMCLTLGAENAKLRNLLASKTCNPLYQPPVSFPQETVAPYFYRNDQQFLPTHNAFPNQFSTQSIVAMSDAGIHTRGDFDSLAMSEDGTDVHPSVVAIGESQSSVPWQVKGDSVHSYGRRTSGGGTYAESDISMEQNAGGQESHAFSGFHRVHQQDSFFGPIPLHGIESRLSKDITRYMQALKSQLRKSEPRRSWAMKQLETTVKALWPRAQLKMYGSHVTQLCLPSSDMDFVISLPAVHKNAPATAPGDLEGRNAIIETNQKVLARKLKSESWLDQRSIKVIERTAVPVIKVSTKDSRSRVVQLDLSFDAKEHHGLEALNMVQHILEQLPMVRPLVLVLKQFLLDRGLLTAYTGGLSSYCLFLMVARYCQEQAPTWNDCGSLLMGLLDFYGNFFDPRTNGISVRTKQYFFRSQDAHHSPQIFPEAQGWNTSHQSQFPDLTKRNSFSSKPHRFQPLHRQFSFTQPTNNTSLKSGKFDPIWVEDPLNPGNNVGRNAFRIFQVQRAFSDAHRALVASLEWDINSMHEFGDDSEYPLLKCLLQNEDVFLAIDEPIHR